MHGWIMQLRPIPSITGIALFIVLVLPAIMPAQTQTHPVLDSVREAIDQRNLRHDPRHNELRVE
jgi:hypothetical protein